MTYDFVTYDFITPDFIIKVFFVGLISLALAYAIFTRSDVKSGSESTPIIHGALLPSFLVILIILFLIIHGREATFKVTLSMCFSIFLHMSIYYIILILMLPYIRKHISARSCALLWIVPNYLYFTQNDFMNTSHPLIVFQASSTLVKVTVIVWFAGFAACFMYSILHHLLFRRSILKDGADDETKRRYADLILTAAGSDAGFSTCLSASACAMRYRLKSIVNPPKRHNGALAVSLTFFILCMTSGYVALAYGEDTAATTIYSGHHLSEYSVSSISLVDEDGEGDSSAANSYYSIIHYDRPKSLDSDSNENYDADAADSATYDASAMELTEYISQMKTQEITGNYSLSNDYKFVSIIYHGPHELLVVDLYSDFITVTDSSDSLSDTYTYHLPEPTDWNYVNSILQTIPVAN